jgi:hypothetical protein
MIAAKAIPGSGVLKVLGNHIPILLFKSEFVNTGTGQVPEGRPFFAVVPLFFWLQIGYYSLVGGNA